MLFSNAILSNLYLFLWKYKNIILNMVWDLPLYLPHLKDTLCCKVVLYKFHKDVNVSAAIKSIHCNYGTDALNERSYRRGFSHFKTGNFHLEDETREGCPKGVDQWKLEAAVTAIVPLWQGILKGMGNILRVKKWVLHNPSPENR